MQAAPPTGMDAYAKDVIEVVFWFVAIIGAFITVWKALVEVRENRLERNRDMRWSQARVSKEMLDEMFDDPHAKAAMTMLDWNGREFEIEKGIIERFYEADILHGLRTTDLSHASSKDIFVRDSFDRFFYYVDRIEQSIRIQLINFEDVKFPLDYYAEQMSNQKEVYEKFMTTYGYRLAAKFFSGRLNYSLEPVEPTGDGLPATGVVRGLAAESKTVE